MAITATFSNGILTITGDDTANAITVSRDLSGTLLVNGGTVPITGGIATIANTTRIDLSGLGDDDVLRIDDANGSMPAASVLAGNGTDAFFGGAESDTVTGGQGPDTALMAGGDDTFIWNPGDGSDIVEGQAGTDTMVFNGANLAERIDLAANGSRLRLSRDVGTIVMDTNEVEHVQVNALGGPDTITVNDLTGTGVSRVAIDLSGMPGNGQGDAAADSVIVGGDQISVADRGTSVVVNGLTVQVTIAGAEAAAGGRRAVGRRRHQCRRSRRGPPQAHPERRCRQRHRLRQPGR